MHSALFVTGTDTGVGKTYITLALARQARDAGLAVGIYKPACSGAEESPDGPIWGDVSNAWQALGGEYSHDLICPQRFLAPLAPPEAAKRESRTVDRELLRSGFRDWQQVLAEFPSSLLLVEGAGGWLSPLAERETNADLAADLNLPALVVAANRLGVVNHTLLTLESIRARGLSVAGVVLNQPQQQADQSASSNARLIAQTGKVQILAEVTCHGSVPCLDHLWSSQPA